MGRSSKSKSRPALEVGSRIFHKSNPKSLGKAQEIHGTWVVCSWDEGVAFGRARINYIHELGVAD